MDLALYRTGVHDDGEDPPLVGGQLPTSRPLPDAREHSDADSPASSATVSAGALDRRPETVEDQEDSGLVWLPHLRQALQARRGVSLSASTPTPQRRVFSPAAHPGYVGAPDPPRPAAEAPPGSEALVMSMHRLTAGAGYQYLLRHTASGDTDRVGPDGLTGYYAQSGNPPGRWLGSGLAGLDGDAGIMQGAVVTEDAMAGLFGQGHDPISRDPLGRPYPTFTPAAERIATAVAQLPATMGALERQAAVDTINRVELAKPTRAAVAGFDLTFTVPKYVSSTTGMPLVTPGRRSSLHQSPDEPREVADTRGSPKA